MSESHEATQPDQAVASGSPERDPGQRISAHLAALDTLDSRPLAEHADIYQRIHAELQGALAEIDGS